MNAIWKQNVTPEKINTLTLGTLIENLGIKIIAIHQNSLEATMPVDHRTLQPFGTLHGGASCALAETAASIASYLTLDPTEQYSVGMDINTSHIRPAKEGILTATASPLHLGKKSQIWIVQAHSSENKLISYSRVTVAILEKLS